MFHYGVKMTVIKAAFYQVGMTRAHVFAGVIIWATKGHGQEGFLLGSLFVHINVIKKTFDAIVSKNFAVEDINSSVDGGFATNFDIVVSSCRW
jgi:hypothetical protein